MPPSEPFAFENEIRLVVALLLNAAALVGPYRFAARRMGGDVVRRWVDAFLLYYLIQYVVVGGLGLLGVLAPATIAAGGLLASAALAGLAGTRHRSPKRIAGAEPKSKDSKARASRPGKSHVPDDDDAAATGTPHSRVQTWALWGAFAFFVGFVAAVVHFYRFSPPLANDALTYHIPAAAQWLQTGKLGLYETWFYNPANTYSPLAGSMFIAWLIAPMGSDLMARFVEVGPLLMIFWALTDIGRRLGAGAGTAAVIAAGAVLSRPFVSQVLLAKDDVFVAAFFLAAVAALADHSRPRWNAVRAGVAVGLMLATKYTALMSVPLLALMIDAPFRAGWRVRHWLVALGLALALAAPWYVRNALLTGNPLFPTNVTLFGVRVFDGMMTVTASDRLQPWAVMTQGYYAVPVALAVVLILAWLVALVLRAKQLRNDPLVRVTLVGPVIGIALFLLTSPYAEMRFVYPSLLLLFACCCAAVSAAGRGAVAAGGAAAVAIVAVVTSFAWGRIGNVATFAAAGAVCVVLVWVGAEVVRRAPGIYAAAFAGVVLLLAAGYTYVHWNGYVQQYREAPELNWSHADSGYEQGRAWAFVRNQLPPRVPLAYANAYLIHPLMGFRFDRPVVYAPTQPGVTRLHDLPRFPEPTTGERIPVYVAEVTWRDADRDTWLKNLRASGAQYLYVSKRSIADPTQPVEPPELGFARALPDQFERVYEDAATIVYRIRPG